MVALFDSVDQRIFPHKVTAGDDDDVDVDGDFPQHQSEWRNAKEVRVSPSPGSSPSSSNGAYFDAALPRIARPGNLMAHNWIKL